MSYLLIVNEDMVIIDGHNRQRLCQQHGLPYQMAVFSFESMLEAKQLGSSAKEMVSKSPEAASLQPL